MQLCIVLNEMLTEA